MTTSDIKHNKKRNIAFLYEILTRELTKAIIHKEEDYKNNILLILKEFFKSDSILKEELSLYDSILNTYDIDKTIAEKIISEARRRYLILPHEKIFVEQSRLIKRINKDLKETIYSNYVPNYKCLASIYNMFNTKGRDIKNKVLLEQQLVDRMSNRPENDPYNSYKLIDNVVLKTYINKYNDKYSYLLKEQRQLINAFIKSFSDEIELKMFLNEEIKRLKTSLTVITETQKDEQQISKLIDILKEFSNKPIDRKMVLTVMQIQEVVNKLEQKTNGK